MNWQEYQVGVFSPFFQTSTICISLSQICNGSDVQGEQKDRRASLFLPLLPPPSAWQPGQMETIISFEFLLFSFYSCCGMEARANWKRVSWVIPTTFSGYSYAFPTLDFQRITTILRRPNSNAIQHEAHLCSSRREPKSTAPPSIAPSHRSTPSFFPASWVVTSVCFCTQSLCILDSMTFVINFQGGAISLNNSHSVRAIALQLELWTADLPPYPAFSIQNWFLLVVEKWFSFTISWPKLARRINSLFPKVRIGVILGSSFVINHAHIYEPAQSRILRALQPMNYYDTRRYSNGCYS